MEAPGPGAGAGHGPGHAWADVRHVHGVRLCHSVHALDEGVRDEAGAAGLVQLNDPPGAQVPQEECAHVGAGGRGPLRDADPAADRLQAQGGVPVALVPGHPAIQILADDVVQLGQGVRDVSQDKLSVHRVPQGQGHPADRGRGQQVQRGAGAEERDSIHVQALHRGRSALVPSGLGVP